MRMLGGLPTTLCKLWLLQNVGQLDPLAHIYFTENYLTFVNYSTNVTYTNNPLLSLN